MIFNFISLNGQTKFDTILENAKNEFKRIENLDTEEYYQVDYTSLVKSLEKAIKLKPDDSESRYFLGYVYSRMNAKDGRTIIDQDLDLTVKSSEQFEIVNQLTPKYQGEIIVLDPYSKISAEWGSVALKYLFEKKKDSAIWAFQEGKRRGGFSNYCIEMHREILSICSKNSVLISSGDMSTLPLYYLQTVENYRNDISVMDVNLLNTKWYPDYLSKNKIVEFDLSDEELESIDYIEWSNKLITINEFSWIIKPSYDKYLLRGDQVFLSFLKQNNFFRTIYLTRGFNENSMLNLENYLRSKTIVNELIYSQKDNETFDDYKKSISKILKYSKFIDKNNPDDLMILDGIRFSILKKIESLINTNEKKKAKKLIRTLDKFANESIFPYQYKEDSENLEIYRQKIKTTINNGHK